MRMFRNTDRRKYTPLKPARTEGKLASLPILSVGPDPAPAFWRVFSYLSGETSPQVYSDMKLIADSLGVEFNS